jgi:hypothetical protein
LKQEILRGFFEHYDAFHLKTAADFHLLLYPLLEGHIPPHEFADLIWRQFRTLLSASPQDPVVAELLKYPTYCAELVRFADYFQPEHARRLSILMSSIERRPDPVPTLPSLFLTFMFSLAYKASAFFVVTFRKMISTLNCQARTTERRYGTFLSTRVRFSHGVKSPETYRLSSFANWHCCPVCLHPTAFPLHRESPARPPRPDLFGLGKHTSFFAVDECHPHIQPLVIFSGHFNLFPLIDHFSLTFGDFPLGDCRLVRRAIDIPCVYGIDSTRLVVLADASLRDGELWLRAMISHALFLESVLANEFGSYDLFCGHPVFTIELSTIYFTHFLLGDVSVHSFTLGSCILRFREVPAQIPRTNIPALFSAVVESWRKESLSNSDFLISLNIIAHRSFDDITRYPIFPRVLADFSAETFLDDLSRFRNLSESLPVLCDREPDHTVLQTRMEMQGYHHCENLSSPVSVSSFLVRLMPFYEHQMLFHDGFDQFERIFTSIPKQLAISPMSFCELGPEHFLCPEMFENINGIVLPDGVALPMEFPKWAQNPESFVELHRYALESYPIRSRIHQWIDLTFGYKSRGPEAEKALNLFNPLGYPFVDRTTEEETMRYDWIQMSGQCPHQIFTEPFPKFKHVHAASDIGLVLGDGFDVLDRTVTVSPRKVLAAVTDPCTMVVVYRMKKGEIDKSRRQALLLRNDARFSVVNDNQFLCATVCQREVVVWSVINGTELFVIDVENVRFLIFDQEMNRIYIATENVLFQYSLTGKRVRDIGFEKGRVTALALFGMDFTFDHRLVLVGMSDGSVRVLACDFMGPKIVTVKISRLSQFPIVKIAVRAGSHIVDAFDSAGKRWPRTSALP